MIFSRDKIETISQKHDPDELKHSLISFPWIKTSELKNFQE